MANLFYINSNNRIFGGNKIVFEHCNRLAERFQRCFIVCDDDVPNWMKVDAYFLDRDTAAGLMRADDAVIFHWDHDADYAMKSPAKNKFYLIQSFIHLDESIFRLPIKFISVSGYVQKHTKDNYGVDSFLIMNGINKSVFYPRPVKRGDGRIFVIDRCGWKGAQDVKKAECIVKKHVRHARFIYKDNLNEDEVACEYSMADIFIFPSWYEGFGLPGLEAMACGAALITTDSKGIDDYAFHEINCLKVAPKNPDVIAGAIIWLLNDAGKRERFRKEGLATAAKFAWDGSIDKLAALLGLKKKIDDRELFRVFANVKTLTTVSDSNYRPFGQQIVRKKTVFAQLRRHRGGTRLVNLLKYFGIREEIKYGAFDYNKVNFVEKESANRYINCKEGTHILYVPNFVGENDL